MTRSFTIDGPLVGAVRTTQRQKWVDPRYKKYQAFKERVRLIANAAGVPDEIPKDGSASVFIRIHWEKRARADCDNVGKSFLDALWKNDRRVLKLTIEAIEHEGREEATVVVGLVE